MLREVAPVPMQMNRNLAAIHPALATQDSILREYLRVLIKRKWIVVGTLAVVFGAVLIATLRTTPIYDAVGSIAINKPDPMLQSLRDAGNSGVDYYDPTDLDTFYLVLDHGLPSERVLQKSRAALAVLRAIGGPWLFTQALRVFPDALLELGYDFIARRRYRWFGRYDSCPLPDPRTRAKFLDTPAG